MRGHTKWKVVDQGFRLETPVLKRSPGRPRKRRFKTSHEKGSRLGARKNKCKHCGGLGHIKRVCKNDVPWEFEANGVTIAEDSSVEEEAQVNRHEPSPLEK